MNRWCKGEIRQQKSARGGKTGFMTAVLLMAALSLAGCGGNAPQGEGSAAVAETTSESEQQEASALASASVENVEDAEATENSGDAEEATKETQEQREDSSEEATEAETYDSTEAYAGTVAAEGVNEAASPYFGVMHARITGVQEGGGDGGLLYTLQDLSDPENAWAISDADIGDVEVELKPGSSAALLFHGDIVNDSENVRFIAVVPEGQYVIRRTSGVTTQNVMSTFALRTDAGEELMFLKDNCEMEEGAMQNDSGDAVVVYYAQSADGTNYPLKIYKAS